MDSGLPDFRGDEGFWRAYPPYRAPAGGVVVTSNVDGHFHASGFDPDHVWEVHGTLRYDQCLARCGQPLFPAGDNVEVDTSTMRAQPPLPSCPTCGALARPNVLRFGDGGWNPSVSDAQQARFQSFLVAVSGARLAVVECGAGTAVPTIRRIGEQLVSRYGATLVRINPREPHGAPIGLPMGAVDALAAIDRGRAG